MTTVDKTEGKVTIDTENKRITLTKEEMLPKTFVAILQNRFIVRIPGFDSFLIKAVRLSGLRTLEVDLHLCPSPSTLQQIEDWGHDKTPERTIQLDFLDALGTVISSWQWEGCTLYGLGMSLSYDKSDAGFVTMLVQTGERKQLL